MVSSREGKNVSHQDVSCLIVSAWLLQACLLECHAIRPHPRLMPQITLLPISLPMRYSEMGSTTGMIAVRVGFKYVFVLEYQNIVYLYLN